MFSCSREDIVREALKEQGTEYRHQGREAGEYLDCVGLLVVVAQRLGYPIDSEAEEYAFIHEPSYKMTPSAKVLISTLRFFCDEIPLEEVGLGDIYLTRYKGAKPRHTMIKVSEDLDIPNGVYPKIIHADGPRGKVAVESVRRFERQRWLVSGFRLRGLEV